MRLRFPAKKNAGCPKAPRDCPPRKDVILQPPLGCRGTPFLFPQSLYGWAYADVRTQILGIDRLANFLTHGAPFCGFRPQMSSTMTKFEKKR